VPSKDWLNFVVTTKARHRIRQWYKVEERERAGTLGREMLEKEFRKEDIGFNKLLKDGTLDGFAKEMGVSSAEDLFASVGFGKISPRQILAKLSPQEETQSSFMGRMVRRIRKPPKQGIKVRGVGDVLVRFPGCCNPLPGEEIVGYITQGRGVTIHSARCKSLSAADPERRVDVEWDLQQGMTYPVRIRVTAQDKPGGLSELSGAIADAKADITKVSAEVTPEKKSILDFTLQVTGKDHLRQVMQTIRRVKYVDRVARIDSQGST
jgi:guanosine-3',5'-bis(diphosphate) 3'-pyrophosphohydrolase